MRIGIIGHFAFGRNDISDGQTVKTRTLFEALKEEYPNAGFYIVDTYNYKKRPLKTLFNTIQLILNTRNIFVLLSVNGRKMYFPMLYYISKIKRINVYHDVIGGSFAKELKLNKRWIKYVNSFVVNWVEVEGLKEEIESLGIKNAEVLPNFKKIKCINENDIIYPQKEIYEFCTFSRVCKEKGITTAIDCIDRINKRYKKNIAKLHIYGKIDDNYREEFSKLLNENIIYEGIVDYNKSVEILNGYYMLLFPSTYPGECYPGTIIDAYSSGVPVISSDWRYNSELVINNETGFLYNYKSKKELLEKMDYSINNTEEVNRMRKKCLEYVKNNNADRNIKIIKEKVKEYNGGGNSFKL